MSDNQQICEVCYKPRKIYKRLKDGRYACKVCYLIFGKTPNIKEG